MLSRPPSKRAARDAVLKGRTVAEVDEDTLRVGEGMLRVGDVGASPVVVVPRVFSHEGGFCEALLVVDCRRFACDGVVGVSFGFSGELFGVDGRTVDGEASRMEPGLRKGDWRGLLKESGEGLYGVGVVDCSSMLAGEEGSECLGGRIPYSRRFTRCGSPLLPMTLRVLGGVDSRALAQQRVQTRQTFTPGSCRSRYR